MGCGSLERKRRKRWALSLKVFAVRPSIGQTLANDALSQLVGALSVIHAKRNAVVMTEIELRQIAMQMLLGAMLIGAEHAAFENREVAFDGVRGDDRGFDNRLAIARFSSVTSFQ